MQYAGLWFSQDVLGFRAWGCPRTLTTATLMGQLRPSLYAEVLCSIGLWVLEIIGIQTPYGTCGLQYSTGNKGR